jgi:hypothetical protein
VCVAHWNVGGLNEDKQADLLSLCGSLQLDIMALTETHLVTAEQQVHWQNMLDGGFFAWYGRAAVRREGASERIRGSGGVGVLVHQSWTAHCRTMPACGHPFLHFVRLQRTDMLRPVFVGVVYRPTVIGVLADCNEDLMTELMERTAQYEAEGAVILLGDFNIHINELPSSVESDMSLLALQHCGPVDEPAQMSNCKLVRRSVDKRPICAASSDFMDDMEGASLVVLNGLEALGGPAEATRGESSVIDLIIADAAHWMMMDAVTVVDTQAEEVTVVSDHRMVASSLYFEVTSATSTNDHGPREEDNTNGASSPDASGNPVPWHELGPTMLYRVNARGDPHHFDAYMRQCELLLTPLTQQWQQAAAADMMVPVEEAWADFKEAMHQALRGGLGARRPPLSAEAMQAAAAASRRMPHSRELSNWRQRRRIVWMQLRECPRGGRQEARLQQHARQLSLHIRNCIRTHLRRQQLRQLEQVRAIGQDPRRQREYWQQVKAIGRLDQKSEPVPRAVLDDQGVEHTSESEVKAVWREAWASLARHAAEDERFDASFHDEIVRRVAESEQIEDERAMGQPTPPLTPEQTAAMELNVPIELEEVRKAVRRLQAGKAAGCDAVCAEALREGGDVMLRCLLQLCRLMWRDGAVPDDMTRGVVVPIHKDGDRRAPLNYRPITLLSIVGKVWTSVLQARLLTWLEAKGIIMLEQGGFRPRRGCADQVFALTELIKLRRVQGRNTFACFIDIRKAYDMVWHDGLKMKLLDAGVHGPMYAAIRALYKACSSSIRLAGEMGYTTWFPIETGVRQGCVLSPTLYSLFINDMAKELKSHESSGVGLPLVTGRPHQDQMPRRLCLLMYADDIVLLGEDAQQLQILMDGVAAYARRWRFEVNHAKCGLMCFRPGGVGTLGRERPPPTLLLGGKAVDWVTSYVYLGVEMHGGRPFGRFRLRMLRAAKRASYAVSGMGLHSGKMRVALGVQLYKALVRPLLEYCAEVSSVSAWPQAERLQTSMMRRILGAPMSTSAAAMRGELGWKSMEARFQMLRVGFWGRIQAMAEDCPARLVYDASLHHCALSRDAVRPTPEVNVQWATAEAGEHALVLWPMQVRLDLFQLGLDAEYCNPSLMAGPGVPPARWATTVRQAIKAREDACWWKEVRQHERLQRVYVPLKTQEAQDRGHIPPAMPVLPVQRGCYLDLPHGGWNDARLRGRRLMTALRCGSSDLAVSVNRWQRVPEHECVCPMCAKLPAAVETERHFVLECTAYAAPRLGLLQRVDALILERCGIEAQVLSARSSDECFAILLGARPPVFLPRQPRVQLDLQRQVLAWTAVELAKWMDIRRQALKDIEEVIAAGVPKM